MFKLPELTWELDCEPLGYPGLVVELVLNPPIDQEEPVAGTEPWDGPFYRQMARIIKGVTVPAAWSSDLQEVVLELGTPESIWQLEHDRGFDPQVFQWALRQYAAKRQERLQVESKN